MTHEQKLALHHMNEKNVSAVKVPHAKDARLRRWIWKEDFRNDPTLAASYIREFRLEEMVVE